MTLEQERKECMFSEYANPDRKKPFDYREGRFFRLRKAYLAGGQRPNTHCVQCLGLCGSCSKRCTLAYEDKRDIVILWQRADLDPPQSTMWAGWSRWPDLTPPLQSDLPYEAAGLECHIV
jgi:hypothetical protein